MADLAQPQIIVISGFLDAAAAAAVVQELRRADHPERSVVIEFGARAKCDLVALSSMAEAISRLAVRVTVRGLSGHDVRILRYLGVSLPGEPEESRDWNGVP